MLNIVRHKMRILFNKSRFVKGVCSGNLVVSNRKRKEELAELKDRGYKNFSKEKKNKKVDKDQSSDELEGENESYADLSEGDIIIS